jgi:beta-glucosidase-like glycosyl hydrolase
MPLSCGRAARSAVITVTAAACLALVTATPGTAARARQAPAAAARAAVALSLTINILRVPYWGRAAETFGEDSYLTSQMAIAEVKGLQSQHVIATTKHFAGNNKETYRLGVNPGDNNVNEYISPRALNDICFQLR